VRPKGSGTFFGGGVARRRAVFPPQEISQSPARDCVGNTGFTFRWLAREAALELLRKWLGEGSDVDTFDLKCQSHCLSQVVPRRNSSNSCDAMASSSTSDICGNERRPPLPGLDEIGWPA